MKYKKNASAGNDIDKVTDVARKLLGKLDIIVGMENSSATDEEQRSYHDRLFGSRTSLVNNLVTLAKLFGTLETAAHGEGSCVTLSQPALSDSDIALVEIFLSKAKRAELTSAPSSALEEDNKA